MVRIRRASADSNSPEHGHSLEIRDRTCRICPLSPSGEKQTSVKQLFQHIIEKHSYDTKLQSPCRQADMTYNITQSLSPTCPTAGGRLKSGSLYVKKNKLLRFCHATENKYNKNLLCSDSGPIFFDLYGVILFSMKDRNRKIVEYIAINWISQAKNQSQFANNHNIDEKTVRRIKNDKSYRISWDTIEKICEARNINLSEFLTLVETTYPEVKIRK